MFQIDVQASSGAPKKMKERRNTVKKYNINTKLVRKGGRKEEKKNQISKTRSLGDFSFAVKTIEK